MTRSRWSIAQRIGALVAAPLLCWLGASAAVPWLIRMVHGGRIPFLTRFMPGSEGTSVEGYLAVWRPIGRDLVVVVLTAALIGVGVVLLQEGARRWRERGGPAGSPPVGGRELLLVAAWFGLVTGLGEAYYYVMRVFYQVHEASDASGISQHAVWMSPTANLLGFLALGLLLLAARQVQRDRIPPRLVIGTLLWTALFVWTMVTGRLHWAGAAVLTLGIAVRIGRSLTPGGAEVVLLVRRTAIWLVLVVIGLGLGVPVLEVLRERGQLASAGVPAPGAPNVLMIVMDTERAISTSLHGADRPTTPFLEELAGEGVQFAQAIAPTSWTLPSHAALFTGRPTPGLGVGWNTPLDDTYPTLAEILAERGYATGGFVSNPKFLTDLFGLGRGFGRWVDQVVTAGTMVTQSWLARSVIIPARHAAGHYQILQRQNADRINQEFLGWLDQGEEGRPFFAFLNYYDAHGPYLPPEPWNLRFSETQPLYYITGTRDDSSYTPTERAELETAYHSGMAYLDDRIRALFAELGDRGLLDNTVVVVTSDHGEEFGEHGALEHGFGTTMPLIHVPLVLYAPGLVPEGARVDAPVELRHLAATVLDLAGGVDPRLGGTSMARYWGAMPDTIADMGAFSLDGEAASLVTREWHFIRRNNGDESLYAYRNDLLELENLIGNPALGAIRDSLREALEARLARGGLP